MIAAIIAFAAVMALGGAVSLIFAGMAAEAYSHAHARTDRSAARVLIALGLLFIAAAIVAALFIPHEGCGEVCIANHMEVEP